MPTPASARPVANAAAASRWAGGPSWEPVKTAMRTCRPPGDVGMPEFCPRVLVLDAGPRGRVLPADSGPGRRRGPIRLTGFVASPTDSWAQCALGHRHWGLAG